MVQISCPFPFPCFCPCPCHIHVHLLMVLWIFMSNMVINLLTLKARPYKEVPQTIKKPSPITEDRLNRLKISAPLPLKETYPLISLSAKPISPDSPLSTYLVFCWACTSEINYPPEMKQYSGRPLRHSQDTKNTQGSIFWSENNIIPSTFPKMKFVFPPTTCRFFLLLTHPFAPATTRYFYALKIYGAKDLRHYTSPK
jgi:hypothetical protein